MSDRRSDVWWSYTHAYCLCWVHHKRKVGNNKVTILKFICITMSIYQFWRQEVLRSKYCRCLFLITLNFDGKPLSFTTFFRYLQPFQFKNSPLNPPPSPDFPLFPLAPALPRTDCMTRWCCEWCIAAFLLHNLTPQSWLTPSPIIISTNECSLDGKGDGFKGLDGGRGSSVNWY